MAAKSKTAKRPPAKKRPAPPAKKRAAAPAKKRAAAPAKARAGAVAKKAPAKKVQKGGRTAPPKPRPARPKAPAASPRPVRPAPPVPSRIAFDEVPWREVAHGAREKALERDGIRLRLLELSGEFDEVAWCLKGHAGVVLEGTMELTLDAGHARYTEGQGFLLLPGEDRHRAAALTRRVLLFVVDFEAPDEPFPRIY